MDFKTLLAKTNIKKHIDNYFGLFGPIKKNDALVKGITNVPLNNVHLEFILVKSLITTIVDNNLNFKIDYDSGGHGSYDMIIGPPEIRVSIKGCKGHKKTFDLSAYRLGRFENVNNPDEITTDMIDYVNECNNSNHHVSLVRYTKRDFLLPNGKKKERDSEYKLVCIDPKVMGISLSDQLTGKNRINSHGVQWGIRSKMSHQLWYKLPSSPQIETITTYSLDELYKDLV